MTQTQQEIPLSPIKNTCFSHDKHSGDVQIWSCPEDQHTSFLWRHTAVNCPSVSFNKIQWHHAYKCRTAVLKRVTASYSGDRLDYHSQVQILLWASKWNINSTKATERNRAPAASVRILLFAPREQVSLENKLRLFDFTFLPIREKPPSPKRPIPVLIASSSTNK